ncbi:lipid droplet-associated hydrolase-like isoform X3 [Symsagittifera roscoffensis]|uniref:lipid droplet-associated hydrolase-like isoform X2 n=1 Tax=Symsagittifera roscoffensis TaxID=84072 RepID=UPI00307C2E1C
MKSIPVVAISHSFHHYQTLSSSWKSKLFQADVFNLQQQVQHKVDFINQFFTENTEVILIGHSIGGYVCLKLLQHYGRCRRTNSDIAENSETEAERQNQRLVCYDRNLVHGYLMMPTFERMKVSPRGQQMLPVIQHLRYLVLFLHFLFTSLVPKFWFLTLIGWFKTASQVEFVRQGVDTIYRTRCLCNFLYMASDELETVKALDKQLIQDSISKTTFYYTPGDGWAPAHYGEELRDRMGSEGVKVIIGQEGFAHQFLDQDSESAAEMILKWCKADEVL